MKKGKCIIFSLTFFLIICTPYFVCAAGVESIIEETENVTAPFGFRLSDTVRDILAGAQKFTFRGALEWLLNLLFSALLENLSTILKMTAAGVISGIAALIWGEKNEIGTLSCVAVVSLMAIETFSFAFGAALEAIDTMFLFISSMFPSLIAANSAVGGGHAAASSIVFAAMQVFIYLCKEIMLPFAAVILTFSIADKLSGTPYLKGVVSLLKQGFKWCTGLLLIFYGAVIGLQTHAAGAFDTLAGKTVKYAVGSFVPVVGGALSDSLEMVASGAKAIKSALGIGGIIGVCCVSVGPLVNVCALGLSFKLAACLCAVTSEKRVTEAILEVGQGIIRICGILLSVCVMFIISLSMLCMLLGGGTP